MASDKVDAVIKDKIKSVETQRGLILARHAQELNAIDRQLSELNSALGMVDDRLLILIQKLNQHFDLRALLSIT